MVYQISNGIKEIASRHGLRVEPSRLKTKKISVFKGDEYLGSVGAIGYDDYFTFKKNMVMKLQMNIEEDI